MERMFTRLLLFGISLFPVGVAAEGVTCNLALVHSVTNATCTSFSNGSINLTASGQNGAVTYLWSTGATSEDLSGLAAATYTVTATDAMGCMAFDTVVVGATTTVSVDLGSDTAYCDFIGRVLAPVLQGATQYQWQNGASTSTLNINAAGVYSVYVQNQAGCFATDTVVLTQLPQPIAAIATKHPGCGSLAGLLDLSVGGGTPPYSYTWSNGATTEDLMAVPNGSYAVTASDSNGCKSQTSAIVIAEGISPGYEAGGPRICGADSVRFRPFRYGMSFDGVDDYLEIPDIAAIRPSPTFTIACWLFPESSSGQPQTVIEKRTPAQNGYIIRFDPVTGRLHFRLQNGPLLSVFSSNDSLPAHQWSHLAMVVNGTTVSIYINGVLDHSLTYTGGIELTIGTPVRVGGGPGSWDFKGIVDALVHWKIALTPSEVSELSLKDLPASLPEMGLYLNFDQAPRRAEATDWSANSNHAQLINMDTMLAWVEANPMQLDFLWTFGDGGVSSAEYPSHAYIPGTFQSMLTTLTTTSAQGCESIDTLVLPVHIPADPFIMADTAGSYCLGDTVRLWLDQTYVTYNWSTGEVNDSITVVNSGLYAVTASDTIGCVHTGDLPINFNPNSTPMPVITPGGNLILCLGDTLVLDAGAGYASYNWNNGAISSTVSVVDSGVFVVTVGNGFGCENTSDTVFVSAIAPPMAAITASNDTLFATAGLGHQWYLNGMMIPGAISSFYVPSVNGDYSVVVTGAGGCTTFSDPYSMIVGVSVAQAWGFSTVFPNPTQEGATLRIFLQRPQTVNWMLFDPTGREIAASELKCDLGPTEIALPTSELAKGCYLLKVTSAGIPWVTRLTKI